MDWLTLAWTATGVALCLPLLLILAGMTWRVWQRGAADRRQFAAWQSAARQALDAGDRSPGQPGGIAATPSAGWQGWRRMRVDRLERETGDTVSVWLRPEDERPLVSFLPGQYLTIRLRAGGPKPATRCYSLSAPLTDNRYRITVKEIPAAPGDRSRVSVSTWINRELMPGDLIECRAPQGDFVLDPAEDSPLVLVGAGVGITPLVCMIHSLVAARSSRPLILIHGSRNGQSHIFRDEVRRLAARHPAMKVIHCYSRPTPADIPGQDFHVRGQVSAGLLRQILPNRRFQFCLCGPPTFMQSIHAGLLDWGVPEERIRREAFGPASIQAAAAAGSGEARSASGPSPSPVRFVTSGEEIELTSQEQSILELAESISVEISSGCRAGSCGTCAIRLLKGQVRYREQPSVEVNPGYCLACVAQPDGPVEVEA